MKYLAALIPLLLVACASKPAVKKDAAGNEIAEPFVQVAGQATPTDTALFLAGRPVRQGAGLSQLQQTGEYRAYARESLQRWNYRASRRIDLQNAWQSDHIQSLVGSPRTILYPFGGPDLLYAMGMFPDSSRYVLLGLEPVGSVPDLEHTEPAGVISSLDRHAKATETQLLHGYFITKDMKTDFSNGALQGVTPVLMSAIGFMNGTITGIQSISAAGNPGIQIDYHIPGRGRKTAIYVSGDLSNRGFNGAFQSWLGSNAAGSTAYFKAASYLMQDGAFTSVRGWVLGNCRALVQDDSGIPYKAIDRSQWDVHLFGSYQAPIEFFARHAQPELRAAYDAAGAVPPVTFGSGYQMKAAGANLMIAVRR